MNTRLFSISLLFIITTVILFAPAQSSATQSGTIWVWCFSDGSNPTVYFSRPFDSGMNANAGTFNGLSLGRQFTEYLKGRFGTKGQASCGHGTNSVSQAAASLRVQEFMAQMRQQNKQVVEVTDWNYMRDEVAIKASFNTPRAQGAYVDTEGGLPDDHIYCISEPFNNTVYYAESIALANPSHNPSIGYFRFLQQKYSFKGNFTCPILNEPHAKLYLNSRLAGARAGGKQIVDTGWPAATPTTTAQVPNDRYQDNDQPVQRPTANQATPSTQVKAIASKEVTPALTYCQNNRAISQGYNCACLQVKIYDYRVSHPAETLRGTPTLASFFDGKQFECDKCINASMAKYFARDQAKIAGLKTPAAQNCAAEKFVSLLHSNPIPSHAKEELDSAIKECRQ